MDNDNPVEGPDMPDTEVLAQTAQSGPIDPTAVTDALVGEMLAAQARARRRLHRTERTEQLRLAQQWAALVGIIVAVTLLAAILVRVAWLVWVL